LPTGLRLLASLVTYQPSRLFTSPCPSVYLGRLGTQLNIFFFPLPLPPPSIFSFLSKLKLPPMYASTSPFFLRTRPPLLCRYLVPGKVQPFSHKFSLPDGNPKSEPLFFGYTFTDPVPLFSSLAQGSSVSFIFTGPSPPRSSISMLIPSFLSLPPTPRRTIISLAIF